jgi:hypothetical protein
VVVSGRPFAAPPEVQRASLWNDALSRVLVAFFLLLLTLAVHCAGVALWHAISGSPRAGVPLPSWLVFPGERRRGLSKPAARLLPLPVA